MLNRALVAMTTQRVGSQARLVSTYYDTPDLALKGQGLTLRVREQGGRFIQTVKAGDLTGTNLLSRGEWEDGVAENRPDPEAPQSGGLLPKSAADDLRPLFITDVTRITVEVEPLPGTRIETAIDTGEIRTVGRNSVEPISEIELELKSGNPAALYDVASQLLEAASVRISAISKSERGYRLIEAAEAPRLAFHAEPLNLDPGITVEAALQKIGNSCMA